MPVIATEGTTSAPFMLTVDLVMNQPTGFVERRSPGWDCGPIEGGSSAEPYFFLQVSCRYAYQPGQDITPLRLTIMSLAPSGTVTVTGEGNADPDTSSNTRAF